MKRAADAAMAQDDEKRMADPMDIEEVVSQDESLSIQTDWSDFMLGKPEREREEVIAFFQETYSKLRWGGDCKWNEKDRPTKLEFISVSASLTGKKYDKSLVEKALDILEPVRTPPHVEASSSLDSSTSEKAFQVTYNLHADDQRFLQHLERQRKTYLESHSKYVPYFAIIQSSGYGKSRLIDNLKKTQDSKSTTHREYNVVYVSFAKAAAYPKATTAISSDYENYSRTQLQEAFALAFYRVLQGQQDQLQIEAPTAGKLAFQDDRQQALNAMMQYVPKNKYLFVIDEAANLHTQFAQGDVSFFRCLRRSIKKYCGHMARTVFFVAMSTFSSIGQLSPSVADDPSNKPLISEEAEHPLEVFILGSSFRINNQRYHWLGTKIEDCHNLRCLYSMGRPLWHALLEAERDRMSTKSLASYAKSKILCTNNWDRDQTVSPQQTLALLSVTACLQISPESKYASELVAGYMATALDLSTDRRTIHVTYPSEPILAIAALHMIQTPRVLENAVACMRDHMVSGAVPKGHRGELIVRLLNLLAMYRAWSPIEVDGPIAPVQLKDFLKQFSRTGAVVDDGFLRGLSSSANSATTMSAEVMWEGHVFFTHFVYLSKQQDGPLITHDLLRYAYRRTAAILVEEGRRGIDWIVPVHLGGDKFVGLVGQDKNRVSDKLDTLAQEDNRTTHDKLAPQFFLNKDEKSTFVKAGVDLAKHWPSVLFAVGVDDVGVTFAKTPTHRTLRSNKSQQYYLPCIILTGLDYEFLEEANDALKEFRFFEVSIEDHKKQDLPITYGH